MDRIDIEKLRSLSCESVAMRLGFVVKQHKTLCCFHEDHKPSLTFKKNKWKCWSCGEGGDTISLVQKVLHKDFLDACRWLAEGTPLLLPQGGGTVPSESLPLGRFGGGRDLSFYERFFERPWLNDEARRFLFEERRLDPRVVRWCRLTSWKDKQGVPWLQTPYYSREGKLIGVQNRNLSLPLAPSKSLPLAPSKGRGNPVAPALPSLLGEGSGERLSPRFRFPTGSHCSIYNLPVLNLLKPGETLFITEGCSDCWAMLSAGHKAIAIPSATLLSQRDKELLKSFNQPPLPIPEGDTKASPWGGLEGVAFAMFPDNDAPGERLFLQLKEVLPSLVRHQLPVGCKDFSEYYLKLRIEN